MDKQSLNEMVSEMIDQYLRDNLRIEIKTTSEYNGGFATGGKMYSDRTTVQLILCDSVISESYL